MSAICLDADECALYLLGERWVTYFAGLERILMRSLFVMNLLLYSFRLYEKAAVGSVNCRVTAVLVQREWLRLY